MTNTATDPAFDTDWTVVWAATFGGAAIAMQMGKAAAVLPLIRAEFGADIAQLSIFVSLVSIVAALAGVVFGAATRTLGARRAALIGLWLVTLGSAVGAESAGLTVLMISRLIEAFGFALTVSAMPAVFQPVTRTRDRALALGIWSIWLPAGIAAMMVISWAALDQIGWRGMFRVTAILPALAAVILWGATRTEDVGRKSAAPAPVVRVFQRNAILTVLVFIAFSCTNYVVMAFLPTILLDEFGLPLSQGAVVSFIGAVLLMVVNIATGWVARFGIGFRLLYVVPLLTMIVAGFVIYTPELGLVASIGASFVFALAAGVPPALVWLSLPLLAKEPGELPVLSGLLFQGAGIGQVLGPVATGLVVDAAGWQAAKWLIVVLAAAGIVVALRLPRGFGYPKEA